MRILLDECIPRGLRQYFQGHDVHTVKSMTWAGKKNGELMTLTGSGGFEVFVTVDQNLRYQQNISTLPFAILVLMAPSNKVKDLLPLVPSALAALPNLQPGTCVEIQ